MEEFYSYLNATDDRVTNLQTKVSELEDKITELESLLKECVSDKVYCKQLSYNNKMSNSFRKSLEQGD